MTNCKNCDCGVQSMKLYHNSIKINKYSFYIQLISSISLLGLFYYKGNFTQKKYLYN